MNALLSFIYTLLANDVASACEAFGLILKWDFFMLIVLEDPDSRSI